MEINLSKYKPSTKTLLIFGVALEALWQNQSIRDLVITFIQTHPRWSSLATLVSGIWMLLHNPIFRQEIKQIEEGKDSIGE
jgi:hypothetical protein